MSYLDIANLKIYDADVAEFTPLPTKADEIRKTFVVNDEYLKNIKDTFKTHINNEVIKLCNEVVQESLYFDPVILIKHHIGKTNFVTEMTTLLDNLVDFDVIDYEEECDSEEEDNWFESELV